MDVTGRRRFFDYEISLETGELRRNGQPVPLERQPARVLARLVADAGSLVRREDLQAAVWGEDVHVDFNRGLNYCIRQLRQALDDDAKSPRFIETVARQGYRFVAPVTLVPPESMTLPGRPRRPVRPRQLAFAAGAVLTLGLAADRMVGGNPQHHQIAVAVVQALHDVVF
jgi:DNA-binding winged helix-turn-helix (wHTH) protein